MAKPLTEDEVNAFMRRLKLLIGGIVALFGVPLFISRKDCTDGNGFVDTSR